MTLQQTDNYMKVCMNTWLLCEACIHSEKEAVHPDEKFIKICNDCAQSCMGLVAHFISDSKTVKQNVFNCFLYCRECYNACLAHPEADVVYCGEACGKCAETIKELLFFNAN